MKTELELIAVLGNKVTVAFQNGTQKDILVSNSEEIKELANSIWETEETVLCDLVDGLIVNVR